MTKQFKFADETIIASRITRYVLREYSNRVEITLYFDVGQSYAKFYYEYGMEPIIKITKLLENLK